MVVNREKTKERRQKSSQEEKTKMINKLETGTYILFILIYFLIILEARSKENENEIEKDLIEAQKKKLVEDMKKAKEREGNMQQNLLSETKTREQREQEIVKKDQKINDLEA